MHPLLSNLTFRILFCFLTLFSCNAGFANFNDTTNPAVAAPPPLKSAGADTLHAKVIDAYKEIIKTGVVKTSGPIKQVVDTSKEIELGDVITVRVNNLAALNAEAVRQGKKIILYLDERPIKNTGSYPPTDPADNRIRFLLKRNEDSRDVWTYILGTPDWNPRTVRVSVGIDDKYAVESSATVNLEVIPHTTFVLWSILFVIFLIGFLILANKSDLLRDPVSIPGGGNRKPYSLSRSQAAWWCFLVIASYIFIGVITGDFSTTITSTVLGLLGISAGTAMGSAFVDASKSTPADSQIQVSSAQLIQTQVNQLAADIQAIQVNITSKNQEIQTADAALSANQTDQTLIDDLQNKRTALAALQAALANKLSDKVDKDSQLKKLTNSSENFLLDIISDINGVTFHRFQIVAWTIVLGIIFVAQVYRTLAMPTFDSSLLALLGISAGTYLGLKIPEDTVPKTK